MISTEQANSDIVDSSILAAVMDNPDLERVDMLIINKWQEGLPMVKIEFLRLLDALQLQLIRYDK